MTMQQAIKKAVEGGWKFKEDDYIGAMLENNQFLLGSLFWQSLGNSHGWAESVWGTIGKDGNLNGESNWLVEWHNFIDHLAAGKDINSFFETIA